MTEQIKAQSTRRSRRIVTRASIAIAIGLIFIGVAVGWLTYDKFEGTLERNLQQRLEGFAEMAALRFDARDLQALSDLAGEIPEEDLHEFHWAEAAREDLGVRRIVIFDEAGRVAVDSDSSAATGRVDHTLLNNEAEFSRAIKSHQPVTTIPFPIELEGREIQSQMSFAPLKVPEGASETLPRFVAGVELPSDFQDQLDEMASIIFLWVAVFTVLTGLTTVTVLLFYFQQETRTEELRRKAELADFSGAIAHEIKNPLAAMLTGLQLLSRSLDEKQRKIGSRLEREIHVLDRIVKDFLAFARGAVGKPEAMTMGTIIARVRQQLTDAQEKALELDGDATLDIQVDSVALVQALANLVKNATQAALDAEYQDGRSAKVTIRYRPRGDSIVIDVVDNGLGVSESVKGRLFSPFVSGRSEGSGLGLAIVRRFVEDMRGEVTLLNSAGTGTHFVLKVPRNAKEPAQ